MSLSFTPEQKENLLWLGVAAVILVVIYELGPVMTPFIASAIIAYALNPAVDWFTRRRIGRFRFPRALAVSIVLLVLVAALLGLVLVVVPVLQKEFVLLREQVPNLLVKINKYLTPWLREFGIKARLDSAGLQKLLSQQLATSSEEIWSAVLASARVGGVALLGWMATFVLVPVLLFYLLMDWHALLHRMAEMIPRRWLASSHAMAIEVDDLLAQYLRGQLAVMIILAVFYSVGLLLVRLDVALPVGIITGLLVVIPYLGFGLGLVLGLMAALLQYDGLQGIMLVSLVYGVGQVLESAFLTPRLVGERIGLHPLVVIFALLAFGQLFGFAGVLLALPASAILAVAFKHLRRHYMNSSFYRQVKPVADTHKIRLEE
jgi:predicted PurR-regulated permease PerM